MSHDTDMMQEMAEMELLEYLTDTCQLPGAAHGIALQVIAKGRESLTSTQEAVYERFVVEEYLNLKCTRCGCDMPTCEIVYALMDEGLCGWCNKMASNAD